MYTHNWWHKALFHISQGDHAAVFDAYDNHVWGIEPDYSQDQVGAVSLLARMEVAGHGCRRALGGCGAHMAGRARDTIQPFLDAAVPLRPGAGRAGRSGRADAGGGGARPPHPRTGTVSSWQEVALPAARGVLAHARGDFAERGAVAIGWRIRG